MKRISSFLVAAVLFWNAPCSMASMSDSELWKKTYPLIEESGEIYTKEKNPEERGWLRVITGRDSKIQNIIEDALVILGESVLTDNIDEINKIGEKTKKLRREIAEYKQKIIGAPASSLNPLADTKESLSRKIEEGNAKILEYNQNIQYLKQRAFENIQKSGFSIPKETMEYLTMAPNGSSIARIMSVAMNLKTILHLLDHEMAQQGENAIQSAHTYAGIYFLACRTHVEALDTAIEEIDTNYMPRLEKLNANARDILSEAKKLLRTVSDSGKKTIQVNMEMTEHALHLMEEYKKYLARQKSGLLALKTTSQEKFNIALNTYKTVSISSQVIGMVRNSMSDMERIFNFQIPDLNLIYGDIYKDEFLKLMDKLKEK